MKISRVSKSLALATPLASTMVNDLEAAAYIKFDGVDGESKAAGFEGFVKIEYFKVEINGAVERGGAAEFKKPVLRFPVEQASPTLMLYCATGRVLKNATLILTTPDGDGGQLPFYKITLTNVLVSSYSSSGSADDRPTEELSLNYEKIEWTYTKYDGKGEPTKTVSTGEIDATK